MCGRSTLTQTAKTIAQQFQLTDVFQIKPRYNIAPTQEIATVIMQESGRQFQWMRWGLIPSWAKDQKIGNRLINARGETLTEKPSFRNAFKRRRCLIIADGFYEWQKTEDGKQPYYLQLEGGKPFAFAGLWEKWESPQGEIISCAIVTTDANELIQSIHDRMPVIIPPDAYDRWLDPSLTNPDSLCNLIKPYKSDALKANPVSKVVNNSTNDRPECIEALAEEKASLNPRTDS